MASQLINSVKPDLGPAMDLMMPGMDGWEDVPEHERLFRNARHPRDCRHGQGSRVSTVSWGRTYRGRDYITNRSARANCWTA